MSTTPTQVEKLGDLMINLTVRARSDSLMKQLDIQMIYDICFIKYVFKATIYIKINLYLMLFLKNILV